MRPPSLRPRPPYRSRNRRLQALLPTRAQSSETTRHLTRDPPDWMPRGSQPAPTRALPVPLPRAVAHPAARETERQRLRGSWRPRPGAASRPARLEADWLREVALPLEAPKPEERGRRRGPAHRGAQLPEVQNREAELRLAARSEAERCREEPVPLSESWQRVEQSRVSRTTAERQAPRTAAPRPPGSHESSGRTCGTSS